MPLAEIWLGIPKGLLGKADKAAATRLRKNQRCYSQTMLEDGGGATQPKCLYFFNTLYFSTPFASS